MTGFRLLSGLRGQDARPSQLAEDDVVGDGAEEAVEGDEKDAIWTKLRYFIVYKKMSQRLLYCRLRLKESQEKHGLTSLKSPFVNTHVAKKEVHDGGGQVKDHVEGEEPHDEVVGELLKRRAVAHLALAELEQQAEEGDVEQDVARGHGDARRKEDLVRGHREDAARNNVTSSGLSFNV
uniref:Transmembrane protein n=1 Tax=Steinernema glaseri TaxID=37863 RepID=A0A1I7YXB9_9BILA